MDEIPDILTLTDYWALVEKVMVDYPEWRAGQAAFNVLYSERPDLSEQIRGTMRDPFHNDRLLVPFSKFLREEW